MQFTIIAASHRLHSQSRKVAEFIRERLTSIHHSFEDTTEVNKCFLIDLAESPLPLWSDRKAEWLHLWQPIAKKLKASAGFVFITPEYNGMATAILRNFLLFCSQQELGDKPVTIVSVSAGRSGSYPISDLRAYGFKNTKCLYVPEHIIVRKVNGVLNQDQAQNDPKENDYIQKHIDFALKKLYLYTAQMKILREKLKVIDSSDFPTGM